MAVVNTNISASIAQSALMKNDRVLGKTMEQLSTGSKINSAADDAAGLAISTRMTSQINTLTLVLEMRTTALACSILRKAHLLK